MKLAALTSVKSIFILEASEYVDDLLSLVMISSTLSRPMALSVGALQLVQILIDMPLLYGKVYENATSCHR